MQYKSAFALHRPAAHHLHYAGSTRQLDHVGSRYHVELYQQIRKFDVRRRMIDDDAHGALGRMRAHIDDRTGKTVVHHRRHGDQHLAVEKASALTPSRCTTWHFHSLKVAHQSVFARRTGRPKVQHMSLEDGNNSAAADENTPIFAAHFAGLFVTELTMMSVANE